MSVNFFICYLQSVNLEHNVDESTTADSITDIEVGLVSDSVGGETDVE